MKTENRIIAEFMGWPTVTVGSQWNYNRSLDNSTKTKNLIVVDINDRGVKFDEKMAFDRYGLDFFDGDVFYPAEWTQRYNMNQHHCPVRDYDISWDWLMPVVEKIESIPHPNFGKDFKFTFEICSYSCTVRVIHSDAFNKIVSHNSSKIDSVYDCVVQFIKWYNTQTSTAYSSDKISTSSDIDKVK